LPDEEKDIPTIVVEFVSKGKRHRMRDYEVKRREYLAHGVQEYWVIDRFQQTLAAFRKTAADSSELVISADGTYQPPLLPGFELPLRRLLNLADHWKKGKE
jgi:Uma2 family endonuclease